MYIDLFFDSEPTREVGLSELDIYAFAMIGSVYHVQVTVPQYKSMIAEDSKLAKKSTKVLKKTLKSIRKTNGYDGLIPSHTFSDCIIDLDEKKKYHVDNANTLLTDDEKAKILGEETQWLAIR